MFSTSVLVRGERRARVAAVSSPLFAVPLRDLERSDLHRSWEIPVEWLSRALEDSEATAAGTPGKVDVYLKKSGREVLVKGAVQAHVVMPCARTLEPLTLELEAPMYLLLSPRAPVVEARPERQRPISFAATYSGCSSRPSSVRTT